MFASKSNKQKRKLFFVGILKVTDEKSRIRIPIRMSVERIRGSGSIPKCHGSTTMNTRNGNKTNMNNIIRDKAAFGFDGHGWLQKDCNKVRLPFCPDSGIRHLKVNRVPIGLKISNCVRQQKVFGDLSSLYITVPGTFTKRVMNGSVWSGRQECNKKSTINIT
jgi:hypothetical protein